MKPFKFKEFIVNQDKTAMKIGTDAVLLGAWCSLSNHPNSILDVGSGTGVIALMLAQRSNATNIDAVEIDENAYEQSVENFEQSDWADRLFCYHASFEDFVEEMSEDNEQYDCIISNPPFYKDDYETENEARNKARFTSSLSFEALISGVSELLLPTGIFTTIIPYKEEVGFIKEASKNNLFVTRVCRVRGNVTSEIKRSLLEFSKQPTKIKEEDLVIETERHNYTKKYIDLTKDFYLKM